MADETSEQQRHFEELQEQMRGHDSIVVTDEDGAEYALRYPRATVKAMEAKGVTAQTAVECFSEGTLTGAERFVKTFFLPAFKAECPKVTEEAAFGIWRRVEGKQDLIALLTILFTQAVTSLVSDPTTGGRAKFRIA